MSEETEHYEWLLEKSENRWEKLKDVIKEWRYNGQREQKVMANHLLNDMEALEKDAKKR